jgi:hypothetical protein
MSVPHHKHNHNYNPCLRGHTESGPHADPYDPEELNDLMVGAHHENNEKVLEKRG